MIGAPLERLELSLPAPEADALSTELQGRAKKFYHIRYGESLSVFFEVQVSGQAVIVDGQALILGAKVANSLRRD